MGFLVAAKICCTNNISRYIHEEVKSKHGYQKLQGRCIRSVQREESVSGRRGFLNCVGASLVAMNGFNGGLSALAAMADEKDEGEGEGIVSAFKSLFDPNEKTKSGKVLPKAYLKSAREVVKTLRESLKEDPTDITKFRRTADAAKESIRDYLSNWRGQEQVAREESYEELEKAIRTLAAFYSTAGPSAPLPEEVKSEILQDLSRAEEFL